jgi:hypothetical protein
MVIVHREVRMIRLLLLSIVLAAPAFAESAFGPPQQMRCSNAFHFTLEMASDHGSARITVPGREPETLYIAAATSFRLMGLHLVYDESKSGGTLSELQQGGTEHNLGQACRPKQVRHDGSK